MLAPMPYLPVDAKPNSMRYWVSYVWFDKRTMVPDWDPWKYEEKYFPTEDAALSYLEKVLDRVIANGGDILFDELCAVDGDETICCVASDGKVTWFRQA